MKIGNVEINGVAALAPMAGVADRAFRELCMSFGADYCVSEMVSAKGITYGSKKSAELMELSDAERPCAIQLFGSEPDVMAEAVRFAMQFKPDIIDINMGCPVPKVNSNGCGCQLMTDPKLCAEIVKASVNASDVPVTVKIRKGIDKDHVNAVDVAIACEQAGASAITVHGRTREQMYAPTADWDIIRDVKRAVSVPVIGNGDVFSALDAANLYEHTGCDMIMVGRGALGNPWIFSEINSFFMTDKIPPRPSAVIKATTMLRHVSAICLYKGEKAGMREARKHISWYLKGFKNAAAFRNEAGRLETLAEFSNLVKRVLIAQNIKETIEE
ncbi:MAG: tRNA dihydrouridine synthase DusB [Clostridia bacterium]|nr:tRNA dihydrouridine synthase DusB [Clostridia bacterium]